MGRWEDKNLYWAWRGDGYGFCRPPSKKIIVRGRHLLFFFDGNHGRTAIAVIDIWKNWRITIRKV